VKEDEMWFRISYSTRIPTHDIPILANLLLEERETVIPTAIRCDIDYIKKESINITFPVCISPTCGYSWPSEVEEHGAKFGLTLSGIFDYRQRDISERDISIV
jgi:hypothetical protein